MVTVAPDLGYKQIVDLLIAFGVSAAPVVAGRHVLGVVSEADLLHKVEFDGVGVHAGLFERRRARRAKEKAVGEHAEALMTAPAVTVLETTTLTDAARLMEQRDVKRLPVLDEAGSLVGIISRRDLLRRYLREDTAIRDDVIESVLRGIMWIDPIEVDVTVTGGHVTLAGKIDRRSSAEIVARLVRRLDGVVGVTDDDLQWGFDDTKTHLSHTFDA
ncbi:CBS domain-containing protein [Dactylosporangium sp. CS-047395]|uniref:CBS domain-containing protein n=1 Tax=Dactylosporangium sp. CS-047395 TaxID=3239936 RepID=UPI003D925B43